MTNNRGSRNGPLAMMIQQGMNPRYSEFVAKSFVPKQPKTGFKLPEIPLSTGNPWAMMEKKK